MNRDLFRNIILVVSGFGYGLGVGLKYPDISRMIAIGCLLALLVSVAVLATLDWVTSVAEKARERKTDA